jgi:probable rRNA maturation factor
MPLSYINQTKDKAWSGYRSIIKKIMKEAILLQEITPLQHVNVVLVRDESMHYYNLNFKGKDYPTDVLTFVSDDEETLADVFINVDAATRQALEYGHSVKREMAFLFAHALLHACGYDHENQDDEAKMIARQKELLREYPKNVY